MQHFNVINIPIYLQNIVFVCADVVQIYYICRVNTVNHGYG